MADEKDDFVAESTTEEGIIESLGDIDVGVSSEDEGTIPAGEPAKGSEDGSVAATVSGTGEATPTQPGDAEAQARLAEARQTGAFLTDKQGNVIDRDGKIIAKSGQERRHFEGQLNARRQLDTVQKASDTQQTTIAELRTEIAGLKGLGAEPQRLGLTTEQASQGLKMAASFQKDPVGTMQYLLTKLQAAGHNIEGISGGGVDMSAISQMLDERLKPFVDDREALRVESEASVTAQKQYTDFVNTHPFANVHEAPIARLLAQDTTLTPRAAYFELKSWALERKLDFSKPLADQVTQAGSVVPSPSSPSIPFPDGSGGAGGSGSAATDEDNTNVADPNTSFADIIRDSMREAGMKI